MITPSSNIRGLMPDGGSHDGRILTGAPPHRFVHLTRRRPCLADTICDVRDYVQLANANAAAQPSIGIQRMLLVLLRLDGVIVAL